MLLRGLRDRHKKGAPFNHLIGWLGGAFALYAKTRKEFSLHSDEIYADIYKRKSRRKKESISLFLSYFVSSVYFESTLRKF